MHPVLAQGWVWWVPTAPKWTALYQKFHLCQLHLLQSWVCWTPVESKIDVTKAMAHLNTLPTMVPHCTTVESTPPCWCVYVALCVCFCATPSGQTYAIKRNWHTTCCLYSKTREYIDSKRKCFCIWSDGGGSVQPQLSVLHTRRRVQHQLHFQVGTIFSPVGLYMQLNMISLVSSACTKPQQDCLKSLQVQQRRSHKF